MIKMDQRKTKKKDKESITEEINDHLKIFLSLGIWLKNYHLLATS
jgi:hypothetical protein